MSRRTLGVRALHWASFFTSIAAVALTSSGQSAASDNDPPVFDIPAPHGYCSSTKTPHQQRFLLLVSTIDGKISALNVGNGGKLEWSMDAGRGPLLSSSISRLEMMRNGVLTRLIPSLDGGLYRFDGDGFEALPFTADSLLTSSFKFSEDSSVVGGRESESYGVDVNSGEIRYICSLGGCAKYKTSGDEGASGDILVIQRSQKTIRAVELRSGEEKWNFSVGTHELNYLKEKLESRANIESKYDDEGVRIESCFTDGGASTEENDLDVDLKVIVPTGTVVAVRKDNNAFIVWQHKFDTPIARAWTLRDGELGEVSLFDDRNIPALASDYLTDQHSAPPMLYVGIHQNQLYVQQSVNLAENIKDLVLEQNNKKMPRIKWRPYLASSPSRTPALITHKHKESSLRPSPDLQDDRAVQLFQETEYPYDNGYYLIPDVCSTELDLIETDMNITDPNETDNDDDWFEDPVTVTLWNWKEVVFISVCTSIVVHILLTRFYAKCRSKVITEPEAQEVAANSVTDKSSENNVSGECSAENVTEPEEYKSRYIEDFEQQLCLGKGGFGVVFEAKNRLDDCSYAIKRIALPNCAKSKEKMMREVKALAKLDHGGIVRYYQAWFESPPAGWQEERDKSTGISDCETPSQMTFSPSPSNHNLPSLTQDDKNNAQNRAIPEFNPLRPFGGIEDLLLENSFSAIKKRGSSETFEPHLNDVEDSFEESGSFSLGVGSPERQRHLQDDSTGVQFTDSDTSSCQTQESSGTVKPFSVYQEKTTDFDETNDSFNIIFEDSGCAEKSSNENWMAAPHDMEIDQSQDSSDAIGTHSESLSSVKAEQGISTEMSSFVKFTQASRPTELPIVSELENNDKNKEESKASMGVLYLYIQMQLCQRQSLKDWLSANTQNRDMHYCLDIFDQIVCAVEYVHDNGLMHRDLKPSNIFFSMEGVVKVGDFGLVTAFQDHEDDMNITKLTKRQSFYLKHTDQVGTRLYMSPEQLAGQSYCHKVDIYSLGLILFELLFPFSTQMERVKTMRDVQRLVFPKRFLDNRPLECDFLKQLLSPDPEKRLSAREILDSPLLRGFTDTRLARMNRRVRTRTTSSDSSSQNDL